MPPRVRTVVHAVFAGGIAMFLPAASCTGGERNTEGACPEARCSPATPSGLHFLGATIGEGFLDFGQVKTTAQGGTQSVRLEVLEDGGPFTPFELPYTASIEGAAATVVRQSGNVVVLRGNAPDTGYLRIDDPRGRLYDRIVVSSQPVTRAVLLWTFADWIANLPPDAVPLYAPGAAAYVGLRGAGELALVDESMRITGDGVTQADWDKLAIGELAPGTHDVTVVSAGQTLHVPIEIAAGPDRLETPFVPEALTVGNTGTLCAIALLGDRHIHVPWTFTASNAVASPSSIPECVHLVASSPGTVVVHASAGGLAVDREIPSTASRSARSGDGFAALRAMVARRAAGELTFGDTAGERAAMQQ